MGSLLCLFFWVYNIPGEAEACGSYLYQPSYCLDNVLRCPVESYLPQPGDIVLTCDHSLRWAITFAIALTGPPHHAAIVFARPDGSLAMLEAGPHEQLDVEIVDVLPGLHEYECTERVWVRRRRRPLTPDESARLTAFAMAQEGKGYAVLRFCLQITPFRSRGPIRTCFAGKPHGERCRYFCSELVVEACVAAGLLDGATSRPGATYPRDLFFDRSPNLYLNKHGGLSQGWYPPARWTATPFSPSCPSWP